MKKLLLIPLLFVYICCTSEYNDESFFSSIFTTCDEPKINWKVLDEYKKLVNSETSEYQYYYRIKVKTEEPTCFEYNNVSIGFFYADKNEYLQWLIPSKETWTKGIWKEYEVFLINCHTERYLVGNNLIDADKEGKVKLVFGLRDSNGIKKYGSYDFKTCY